MPVMLVTAFAQVWQAGVPIEVQVKYDVPAFGVKAALSENLAARGAEQRFAEAESKQEGSPSLRGSL